MDFDIPPKLAAYLEELDRFIDHLVDEAIKLSGRLANNHLGRNRIQNLRGQLPGAVHPGEIRIFEDANAVFG